MLGAIHLSQRSLDLINEYERISNLQSVTLKSLTLSELNNWLNTQATRRMAERSKQKAEYILASLHKSLLRDLSNSIDNAEDKPEEKPTSWVRIKFLCVAFSGILLAACEGFDGIATLLTVFSLPSFIILSIGFAFSVLSITVFYGFDLLQVSRNLGFKLRDTPKLLDTYYLQMKEIKSIRKKIAKFTLVDLEIEELKQLQTTLIILQKHLVSLEEIGKKFEAAANTTSMQLAKKVFAGIAGILYFSAGFFAGQSVSMYMLGLFITGATPLFWPVMLFSLVVGLAAFSLYWNVEQVGLKKLISGWFGLNEDKIEQLCNMDTLNGKLQNLDNQISRTIQKYEDREDSTEVDSVWIGATLNQENRRGYSPRFYNPLSINGEIPLIADENEVNDEERRLIWV